MNSQVIPTFNFPRLIFLPLRKTLVRLPDTLTVCFLFFTLKLTRRPCA